MRNGAATLRAALESLRAQTFGDFHVVAVDDGSTDETPWILREELARWAALSPVEDAPATSGSPRGVPTLCVVRLETGVGIAGALIAAVQAAGRPEFFARQDADDVSHPERFTRQVEFLDAHPEIGLVATGVRTMRREGPASDTADGANAPPPPPPPGRFPAAEAPSPGNGCPADGSAPDPRDGWRRYERWLASCVAPEEIALGLWVESPLPHPTVMMRRAAYEQAGGYREVPWPEDYDLWLRMLRSGIVMAKVPEVLYDWADDPGRATRTLPAYTPEAFHACRAHHLARHLDGRGVIVWGAGRDGRRAARFLLRQGVDIRAFLDIDPRKIGRTAYGRPILAAEAWLATRAELLRAGESQGATDAGPTARTGLGAVLPPAAQPGPRPTERSAVGSEVRSAALSADQSSDPHTPRPSGPFAAPGADGTGLCPPMVLAAVGTAGARELIRARLVAAGLREGGDFLCIA